jgi:hypothetical protein
MKGILTLLCLARAWAIDVWGYQDLGSNGYIDVDQDGFLYLIGLTLISNILELFLISPRSTTIISL